jgi:alginate O-acetyltransferase complex protein AlgI
MAIVTDHIFSLSAIGHTAYNVPVTLAWLGVVAYTLQIYFDFSGYSDMAIGLGRMFGFELKENFNYPYIADSIINFWRRWHISLSTWFKEYVYIPLGGSRTENNDLMIRNNLIVWVLTGIWHGAEWTFVIWGLWNFVFIFIERVVRFDSRAIPKPLKHIYAMAVVGIGWMFFRANDVYQASQYLMNMLGMHYNGFFSDIALMFVREYWVFFLFGIIFCTPVARQMGEWMRNGLMKAWGVVFNMVYPVVYTCVFVICIVYLAKGNYNPFIYFNF